MILKTKILTVFLIGFTTLCSAQIGTYDYKRSLNNVSDEWHVLTLPDAVFAKVNPDVSDLRIYGISTKNDTVEAPYFLRVLAEKDVYSTIPFEIINKTKGANGYYFTFKVDTEDTINQIKLNFSNPNFDWKVELQGTNDQQEWFTLLEDYRILSIENESTDFKFTTLNFSKAKFQFYRLFVKHPEKPKLISAKLFKLETTAGSYIDYNVKKLETLEDKTMKTTIVNLEIDQTVAISQLNIDVSNTFDYYRPLKIEYRRDSINTEKGWKYNYQTIFNGTLNSLEARRFKIPNTIAKHFKITITNGDNQPLNINGVSAKGYKYQLIGRFTETADYMLVYGNRFARQPSYDIRKFEVKVPKDLKALKIGEEQVIAKSEQPKVKPLFENSYWLWAIIGLVILILGGFTLRMLKKS